MFRPRVIPALLLENQGLVKSVRFKNHRYIGDPINAVKIFNDSMADELVFLDISATRLNKSISIDFVKKVGEEAQMPFAVGGGITDLATIQRIIAVGAEKVILGTVACENPQFVREASSTFGSSSIVVCIDVKKDFFGREYVWCRNGTVNTKHYPVDFAHLMEASGAGEVIVQSIDNDGCQRGYDIELIQKISESITIPVIALGGASNLADMSNAWLYGYASALAAGSLFVYHGARNGILVNYPSKEELINAFTKNG